MEAQLHLVLLLGLVETISRLGDGDLNLRLIPTLHGQVAVRMVQMNGAAWQEAHPLRAGYIKRLFGSFRLRSIRLEQRQRDSQHAGRQNHHQFVCHIGYLAFFCARAALTIPRYLRASSWICSSFISGRPSGLISSAPMPRAVAPARMKLAAVR